MKVRIFKPHTHAGTRYVPGLLGVELSVSAAEAAFLSAHGLLDPPSEAVVVNDELPLLLTHSIDQD